MVEPRATVPTTVGNRDSPARHRAYQSGRLAAFPAGLLLSLSQCSPHLLLIPLFPGCTPEDVVPAKERRRPQEEHEGKERKKWVVASDCTETITSDVDSRYTNRNPTHEPARAQPADHHSYSRHFRTKQYPTADVGIIMFAYIPTVKPKKVAKVVKPV